MSLVRLLCGAAYGRPLELTGLPILLPACRNPVEQFAGEELGRYLARISGKAFLSVTISGSVALAAAIVIGRAPAEQLGVQFTAAEYGEDGFIMSHRGDRVIWPGHQSSRDLICGVRAAGTVGMPMVCAELRVLRACDGRVCSASRTPSVRRTGCDRKTQFPLAQEVRRGGSHPQHGKPETDDRLDGQGAHECVRLPDRLPA